MTARVVSVNTGRAAPDAHKPHQSTGIDKRPVASIEVFDPGPRRWVDGAGVSGVAGDFLGDGKHHGGDVQAVYAYAAADLAHLSGVVGREFGPGQFGENLTTEGLDVTGALIGERWRIGDAELAVTTPRIPCNTFRAWIDERGWLKTFTREGRSGSYLRVIRPGVIRPGDPVEVVFKPDHAVTIGVLFRSQTLERELAGLVLTAREYLDPESIRIAERRETFELG